VEQTDQHTKEPEGFGSSKESIMRSVNYDNAIINQTAVSVATTAQQTIGAARAGSRVCALVVDLVAAGAVTLQWQSNNNAIGGARTMATGVPYVAVAENYAVIVSNVGEALKFTLGGSVQVSGVVRWTYANEELVDGD